MNSRASRTGCPKGVEVEPRIMVPVKGRQRLRRCDIHTSIVGQKRARGPEQCKQEIGTLGTCETVSWGVLWRIAFVRAFLPSFLVDSNPLLTGVFWGYVSQGPAYGQQQPAPLPLPKPVEKAESQPDRLGSCIVPPHPWVLSGVSRRLEEVFCLRCL